MQAAKNHPAKILKQVMWINYSVFLIEFICGYYAKSTALMADSLDLLGDAAIYGISWYALTQGPLLISAGLVALTGSGMPDVVIGFAIAALYLKTAYNVISEAYLEHSISIKSSRVQIARINGVPSLIGPSE